MSELEPHLHDTDPFSVCHSFILIYGPTSTQQTGSTFLHAHFLNSTLKCGLNCIGSNFAGFFNIFAPDSLKNSVAYGGESVKNQLSEESYSLRCSNLLKILKFVRNAFFQPML